MVSSIDIGLYQEILLGIDFLFNSVEFSVSVHLLYECVAGYCNMMNCLKGEQANSISL